MRVARPFGLVALAALGACTRYVPPAPPAPRAGTSVAASFGRTWDAVIDVFAERNIPIRTIERSSGFVATENLGATASYAPRSRNDQRDVRADCGHEGALVYTPTHAVYNIVVRGDSTRSTVRATVKWVSVVNALEGPTYECSTTGAWEADVESDIRDRAEGARASASTASGARTAPAAPVVLPAAPAPRAPSVAAGKRASGVPVSVMIRVRVPDWANAPAPVADFPLTLVGPDGDTTLVRTDDRGAASVELLPGRYRVVSPQRAGSGSSPRYEWDFLVDVRFPMAPLELDQRNAVRRAP